MTRNGDEVVSSRIGPTDLRMRILMIGFGVLLVTGCDNLIGVGDPTDRIVAEDLEVPQNARLLVDGAIADFECAFSRYIGATGLVGNELDWASTSPWGREFDQRQFSPSEGFYATGTCTGALGVYKPLSTARWAADNALQLLDEWADEDVPNRTSLIATAAAHSGYAHVLLGEGMCSAAFDLGPELDKAQIMERAEQRFSRAIETATAAGNEAILNMAFVGRARARLNLGRKNEAAGDARPVPEGFVRFATYDETPARRVNYLADSNHIDEAVTVHPHFRSLSFEGTSDPRPRVFDAGKLGVDQLTPLWQQEKYTTLGDEIPIATWEEAQLIIAEAELGQTAVDIINTLHARAGLPSFDGETAEEIMEQIIYERSAELFLEGHHLGDVNRYDIPLVPEPGTPYPAGGFYGDARCFPLPDVEGLNNPNIG